MSTGYLSKVSKLKEEFNGLLDGKLSPTEIDNIKWDFPSLVDEEFPELKQYQEQQTRSNSRARGEFLVGLLTLAIYGLVRFYHVLPEMVEEMSHTTFLLD